MFNPRDFFKNRSCYKQFLPSENFGEGFIEVLSLELK